MARISEIWFDGEWIYGKTEEGKLLRQSLLWYPRLYRAPMSARNQYHKGYTGFHWKELDEDISFESFFYPDAAPTPGQRYFLTHPEVSIPSFAEKIGVESDHLYRYKNGFIPSDPKLEAAILSHI